jgi:hypothetical protein
VYFSDGLRIQKCRTGIWGWGDGEGEGRRLIGRRRDLEELVRERVACRVEDRQCETAGGRWRVREEVGRESDHLKRVTAEVVLLK